MKKALLILGAALASSVITSQAQVYSQNVVGYYNVTIPAGKFALVGNQLLNGDGTNGLANVFTGGLVSQSTVLYAWSGSGFVPYTYYSAADASPLPGGFYDGNGVAAPVNATPGNSFFIGNPASTNIVLTVTGSVIQGTNNVKTIPLGFTPCAATVPVTTNINSASIGLIPDSASQHISYYHWNVNSQSYDAPLTYYSAADASPSPGGWYDGNGNTQSWSAPLVGEGFFLGNFSGSTIPWTNAFSVQ